MAAINVTQGHKDLLREIIESQIDLKGLAQNHFRPQLKVADGQAVGSHVIFKGRDCLQLTGQDYLGLTTDPRVIDAAESTRAYGIGALGSAIITGTLDLHLHLQKSLSGFMGSEDAVIFTTGMLANLGCIPAVIKSPYRAFMRGYGNSKSAIFADDRSHESLRMACDLCKAHGVEIHKYHHCDYNHLDELITSFGRDNNLVITDGTFSMDGDIAPLKEITDVAEHHCQRGLRTVVYEDDAHGIGVLGANGRGVAELLDVEDKLIVMGVLSKAFGTLGGFVIGDKWFTDYLSYCSTHMFSLALPPAETAATIESIRIVAGEPYRAQKILKDADYLRLSLRQNGYEVLGDKTQIVFIVIGDENESARISSALEDEGILCPEIKFPAVSPGRAGLRVTTTYSHTQDDLDDFLNKFYKVTRRPKAAA